MREKPVLGQIYHVLNRGVDKRTIFMDDKDYFRFVHDLFEFNDENQVLNLNYAFGQSSMDVGRRYIKTK
jgi:hypothetical protein